MVSTESWDEFRREEDGVEWECVRASSASLDVVMDSGIMMGVMEVMGWHWLILCISIDWWMFLYRSTIFANVNGFDDQLKYIQFSKNGVRLAALAYGWQFLSMMRLRKNNLNWLDEARIDRETAANKWRRERRGRAKELGLIDVPPLMGDLLMSRPKKQWSDEDTRLAGVDRGSGRRGHAFPVVRTGVHTGHGI